MRTVATLIARGGSVRLPRKNVRSFCGLPLIAWSIIQARCSRLIDEVWMCTDDDEIAAISEKYGAKVVREPGPLGVTGASGLRATRYLVQEILDTTGDFDCWVGMLPTLPIRTPDQLDRLVARYDDIGDSDKRVIQAIPMRETVLYEEVADGLQMTIFDKNYQYFIGVGGTSAWNPRKFLKNSDDMPNDDATLDADFKLMAIEKRGPVEPYIDIEVWQQADVDTLVEFELAEVLMEHYILRGRGRSIYDEDAKEKA